MVRIFELIAQVVIILTLICPRLSLAEEGSSNWVNTDNTSVRLFVANLEPKINSKKLLVGLHFKLKDGWKIYWRSPGDAGYPPKLNWSQSENINNIDFKWPIPSRFSISDIETLGYKNEVVFPIYFNIKDSTKNILLRANLNYLACNKVCIPYSAKLFLNANTEIARDISALNNKLITKYLAQIPIIDNNNLFKLESIIYRRAVSDRISTIQNGTLLIKFKSSSPFKNPDLLIEGPELTFFGKPNFDTSKNKLLTTIKVPFTEEDNTSLINKKLKLTLIDNGIAVETNSVVRVSDTPTNELTPSASYSLYFILLVALVGGLILNLMPCVLPIILLKLFSIISQGGSKNIIIRKNFFANALGIIISFLIIGIILSLLKLAGSTVGWGIQFQHPWFIVGLCIIIVIFSLNIFGIFEIQSPGWVNRSSNSALSGQNNQENFSTNFFNGAFATLLATPCSAPFLGTAVGFALAGEILEILLIFIALGIGMALPYLVFCIFPTLVRKMPKPGNWMLIVKKILGLVLIITALWLLSILASQHSPMISLLVFLLLVLLSIVIILRNKVGKLNGTICSLILIIASVSSPYIFDKSEKIYEAKQDTIWQKLIVKNIEKLIIEEKTILVDITADWCITCQVNKIGVLDSDEIQNYIKDNKIVALRGDWTKQDSQITNYLQKFGRYGIPFNAVYGPNIPNGIALPELLTKKSVLELLQETSK